MPSGSRKPPQSFRNFRAVYVSWARWLPGFHLHTSCLHSPPYCLRNTAWSLLRPFLPLLPPPTSIKTPRHSQRAFLSTVGFVSRGVENGVVCTPSAALSNLARSPGHARPSGGCGSVSLQEAFIGPRVSWVPYLKPVFWLLSLISLLYLALPAAQPLVNEANSSPASRAAAGHPYCCFIPILKFHTSSLLCILSRHVPKERVPPSEEFWRPHVTS